jgi:hypothetical protein
MTTTMRAKMQVRFVEKHENCEVLHFNAVCKSGGYPSDGADEDNTFAKWTPSAELKMNVNNPSLFGQFKPGDKFYVDFTAAN